MRITKARDRATKLQLAAGVRDGEGRAAGGQLASAQLTMTPLVGAMRPVDLPVDVAEAWGIHSDPDRVTRQVAMRVPAVKRGRSIICGTIGTLPLVASRWDYAGDPTGTAVQLLAELDPRTTPQWTITWTVDDLLFYGVAWWRVTSKDYAGFPRTVERLAPGRVSIVAGRAYVDGRRVADDELIRFDGPDEGLLTYSSSIRTAVLLELAVRRNSSGMPPQDYLRPAEGAPEPSFTAGSAPDGSGRSEVEFLLDSWEAGRRDHSTAYLNRAIEHQVVGYDPRATQLVEQRQHQAAEVARLMNLDASDLGAPSGDSMTYANVRDKRAQLVDVSLAPYMTALRQRLSMPDVTRRGTVVTWDTRAFLRGTVRDAVDTAVAATTGGVMTAEETRVGILDLAPTPAAGQLPTRASTQVPA